MQTISSCLGFMSYTTAHPKTVDLLILGYGWTGPFLATQCEARRLTTAKTTRDGRDGSIKFLFDPEHEQQGDEEQFAQLPDARTVVIVFPIYGNGGGLCYL